MYIPKAVKINLADLSLLGHKIEIILCYNLVGEKLN